MSAPRAVVLVLAGALALACAPAAPAASPSTAVADSKEPIAWRAYDASAFETARREDKLVLVDVGIEGCTACRWMYEDTYKDPGVAGRVRAGFVAVSVDADVQPDLGARFEPWGWPATIFMTPDGRRVRALRGSRSAEDFKAILDDLVDEKRRGALRASGDGPSRPAPQGKGALRDACVRITRALDKDMNVANGGWTDEGPQYIQGPAIEEALLRAQVEGRPALAGHALKTLEGYAKLLDPVWGGAFVAALNLDFSRAIVEKRLVQNAEALRSFGKAYALTHDPKWSQRAGEIDRYLSGFLLSPEGTFYSTQQDEAPELPEGMSASQYFALPDAERRRYGIPPVDHAVYTDQNGQTIEAYAAVYEATADAAMLGRAIRAARELLASRMQAEGFMLQAAPSNELLSDARKRAFRAAPVLYLSTQAQFAAGLLALYRVTGETAWLDAARRILTVSVASLEDRRLGGFFASSTDATTPGAEKPTYENLVMARALHALAVYTHDDAYDRTAERAARAFASEGGALLALVAEDLSLGALELTVHGSPEDPRSKGLYQAALQVYEPRKAVHYDTAGRYPDRGRPALYACTKTACTSPAFEAEDVAKTVRAAVEPRRSACE